MTTSVKLGPRTGSAQINFGRPPRYQDFSGDLEKYARALEQYLGRMVQALEVQSEIRDKPGAAQYTLANVTLTRTFDADSTTLAEVADVLGTLIGDLGA